MPAPPALPYRRQVLGHVDGVTVIDDSAATTPRKARGSLAGLDRSRLIVGRVWFENPRIRGA